MNTINFRHSGNTGDIIYALPNIKAYCDKHNVKATLFIHLNVPSNFTAENHPVGAVMMNQSMFDMLKPLLESQYYIQNVIAYENESIPDIDFDLDLFRKDYLNLSAGNIAQWIGNSYPELRPNLFEKSIDIPYNIRLVSEFIIVNRSARYQNILVDYSALKDYENVWFVGVESEFKALSLHNKNLQHLIVSDFYQLAQYINSCKLFIGNQSMAFAIAEQLKVPRILEQFAHAPNVIPQGGEYWVTHNNKQFQNALSLALNGEDKNTDTTKTRQTESHSGC